MCSAGHLRRLSWIHQGPRHCNNSHDQAANKIKFLQIMLSWAPWPLESQYCSVSFLSKPCHGWSHESRCCSYTNISSEKAPSNLWFLRTINYGHFNHVLQNLSKESSYSMYLCFVTASTDGRTYPSRNDSRLKSNESLRREKTSPSCWSSER